MKLIPCTVDVLEILNFLLCSAASGVAVTSTAGGGSAKLTSMMAVF